MTEWKTELQIRTSEEQENRMNELEDRVDTVLKTIADTLANDIDKMTDAELDAEIYRLEVKGDRLIEQHVNQLAGKKGKRK